MIRVIGDRVLVLLPEVQTEVVTPSGIVLMKDPDLKKLPSQGIVIQLGEKSNTCDLDEVRSEVHTWFVEHNGHHMIAVPWADDQVDRLLMQMAPAPFDVSVGDMVIFSTGAGEQFRQDGKDYVVLREDDVIGVLEPKEVAA